MARKRHVCITRDIVSFRDKVNFITEINRKLARSEVLAVFAEDAIDEFRFKEYSVDVDFYV